MLLKWPWPSMNPGNRELAPQIDDLRVRADEPIHVGVRSDGDDRAVPRRQRLRLGQRRIERQDAAVPKNEIGRLDLRVRANHGQRQHEDGNESLHDAAPIPVWSRWRLNPEYPRKVTTKHQGLGGWRDRQILQDGALDIAHAALPAAREKGRVRSENQPFRTKVVERAREDVAQREPAVHADPVVRARGVQQDVRRGLRGHQRLPKQAGAEVRNDHRNRRVPRRHRRHGERIAEPQIEPAGETELLPDTNRQQPQCTNTARS